MGTAARSLEVRASNSWLREVLEERLTEALQRELAAPAENAAKPVVVAVVSACTPEECAELVDGGSSVAVLAPVPTDSERGRYLLSGAAAYLPMTVDMERLVSTIVRLFS